MWKRSAPENVWHCCCYLHDYQRMIFEKKKLLSDLRRRAVGWRMGSNHLARLSLVGQHREVNHVSCDQPARKTASQLNSLVDFSVLGARKSQPSCCWTDKAVAYDDLWYQWDAGNSLMSTTGDSNGNIVFAVWSTNPSLEL